MSKPEFEICDADLFGAWRPVEGGYNGTMEKVLAYDPETGNYTRLLKFPPMTEMPETLTHDFCEEIYVVDGYLTDTAKKITMGRGYYGSRPARHDPRSLQHPPGLHHHGDTLPGPFQTHRP